MPASHESDRTPIRVITGPTAAGKSELAVRVAERLGLEIASMDSMAVYRGMDIGTAKPGPEQRARVPHHLIDLVEPHEVFDTGSYVRCAEALLAEADARGQELLFVGGTPLYLMALFKGLLDGPAADPEFRSRLETREDDEPGSLHRELSTVDPRAAQRIHGNDRKRLIRALEVHHLTGRPISSQQDTFDRPGWRLPCRILVVERPPDELRSRIRERTVAMLRDGLLEETRAIAANGGFSRSAAQAIGYAECLQHLRRPFKDQEELRNRIRRSTHWLVRRQNNWFRRLTEAARIPATADLDAAVLALQG